MGRSHGHRCAKACVAHVQEAFALAQAEFVNDPHHDETDTAEIQDVMARLRMDEWRKQSKRIGRTSRPTTPNAMARLKALNERDGISTAPR